MGNPFISIIQYKANKNMIIMNRTRHNNQLWASNHGSGAGSCCGSLWWHSAMKTGLSSGVNETHQINSIFSCGVAYCICSSTIPIANNSGGNGQRGLGDNADTQQGHPPSLATKAIALLHGHQFGTNMIAPFICER